MSKILTLEHKRELKQDETICKGDVYVRYGRSYADSGIVQPVKYSIGRTPSDGYVSSGYKFFRRLHTKKPTAVVFTPHRPGGSSGTFRKKADVDKAKAKYPTVAFDYNYKLREVQVIALGPVYITGLEVNRDGDKPKYQFKKFLRSRLQSGLTLTALADKE